MIVQTVNNIAKNKLRVYIQYSNKTNKSEIDDLASHLKDYYLIPLINFVENKSGYTNKIRYYSNNDLEKARDLSKKVKEITGIDFKLKNINQPKIKNTIEVWFKNTI